MRISKQFLITTAAVLACGGALLVALSPREALATLGYPGAMKMDARVADRMGLTDVLDALTFDELATCASIPACGQSDTSRVEYLSDLREVSATPTARIQRVRRARSVNTRGDSVFTVSRRVLHRMRGQTVMSGLDSVTTIDRRPDGSLYRELTELRRFHDVTFADPAEQRRWPVSGLILLSMENRLHSRHDAAPRLYETASAIMFDGSPVARVASGDGMRHEIDLAARTLTTRPPAGR